MESWDLVCSSCAQQCMVNIRCTFMISIPSFVSVIPMFVFFVLRTPRSRKHCISYHHNKYALLVQIYPHGINNPLDEAFSNLVIKRKTRPRVHKTVQV